VEILHTNNNKQEQYKNNNNIKMEFFPAAAVNFKKLKEKRK